MNRLWNWFESWPEGALTFVAVLSTIATAAAAVLAAVTIVQAKNAAERAQAALLHERRVDHQLDQLMWLLDNVYKGSNVSWVDAGMRNRAALLPIDLIPLTRAALRLPSTPAGQERAEEVKRTVADQTRQTVKDAMSKEISEELEAAVNVLVESEPPERGITRVSRRRLGGQ